jgi:hypothetical protein
MRERGLDPATCEEVEALASSIVATSALQDPADDRGQKLTAVLAYLERRIAGMLEPGAQVDAPDRESAANTERLIESDASVPEGPAVQGPSAEDLAVGVPRSMGVGVLADAAPESPNSSEMGAEQPVVEPATKNHSDEQAPEALAESQGPLEGESPPSTITELGTSSKTNGQIDVEPSIVAPTGGVDPDAPAPELELPHIVIELLHAESVAAPPYHPSAPFSLDEQSDQGETHPPETGTVEAIGGRTEIEPASPAIDTGELARESTEPVGESGFEPFALEMPRPSLQLPKAEDSTASPPDDIGLASTLESPDQPSSPASGESAPVASDRVELAAPANVSAVSHTQYEFAVDEPLSSAAAAQPAHADVSAYSQESTTPDPSQEPAEIADPAAVTFLPAANVSEARSVTASWVYSLPPRLWTGVGEWAGVFGIHSICGGDHQLGPLPESRTAAH